MSIYTYLRVLTKSDSNFQESDFAEALHGSRFLIPYSTIYLLNTIKLLYFKYVIFKVIDNKMHTNLVILRLGNVLIFIRKLLIIFKI